ncbi:MAG: L,D-transpeptidase, partial [Firmicutes bacterium]|nr:L,D-transpeptidase [Bacillota bacterium]
EPDDRAPRGEKYGIHGTDEPSSIGKHASSGCIRLRNRDVEELYDQVQIGTEVEIRP